MMDGTRIPRNSNEPLIQAVQRLRPGHTNYIALATQAIDDDSDADSEYDLENTYSYAFPAEHAPKSTKEARKEHFKGVFPPPRPTWAKRITPDKPNVKPLEPRIFNPITSPPKPVEIRKPIFNPLHDEDIVMKDATYRASHKPLGAKQSTTRTDNVALCAPKLLC